MAVLLSIDCALGARQKLAEVSWQESLKDAKTPRGTENLEQGMLKKKENPKREIRNGKMKAEVKKMFNVQCSMNNIQWFGEKALCIKEKPVMTGSCLSHVLPTTYCSKS